MVLLKETFLSKKTFYQKSGTSETTVASKTIFPSMAKAVEEGGLNKCLKKIKKRYNKKKRYYRRTVQSNSIEKTLTSKNGSIEKR